MTTYIAFQFFYFFYLVLIKLIQSLHLYSLICNPDVHIVQHRVHNSLTHLCSYIHSIATSVMRPSISLTSKILLAYTRSLSIPDNQKSHIVRSRDLFAQVNVPPLTIQRLPNITSKCLRNAKCRGSPSC